MTISIYNIGDAVNFRWDDKLLTGTIMVVDKNGSFENPEIPCYDILTEDMFYKHVPQNDIVKKK